MLADSRFEYLNRYVPNNSEMPEMTIASVVTKISANDPAETAFCVLPKCGVELRWR